MTSPNKSNGSGGSSGWGLSSLFWSPSNNPEPADGEGAAPAEAPIPSSGRSAGRLSHVPQLNNHDITLQNHFSSTDGKQPLLTPGAAPPPRDQRIIPRRSDDESSAASGRAARRTTHQRRRPPRYSGVRASSVRAPAANLPGTPGRAAGPRTPSKRTGGTSGSFTGGRSMPWRPMEGPATESRASYIRGRRGMSPAAATDQTSDSSEVAVNEVARMPESARRPRIRPGNTYFGGAGQIQMQPRRLIKFRKKRPGDEMRGNQDSGQTRHGMRDDETPEPKRRKAASSSDRKSVGFDLGSSASKSPKPSAKKPRERPRTVGYSGSDSEDRGLRMDPSNQACNLDVSAIPREFGSSGTTVLEFARSGPVRQRTDNLVSDDLPDPGPPAKKEASPAKPAQRNPQLVIPLVEESNPAPSTKRKREPGGWGDTFAHQRNKWKCFSCMVLNEQSATKCASCETPRQAPDGGEKSTAEAPGNDKKAAIPAAVPGGIGPNGSFGVVTSKDAPAPSSSNGGGTAAASGSGFQFTSSFGKSSGAAASAAPAALDGFSFPMSSAGASTAPNFGADASDDATVKTSGSQPAAGFVFPTGPAAAPPAKANSPAPPFSFGAAGVAAPAGASKEGKDASKPAAETGEPQVPTKLPGGFKFGATSSAVSASSPPSAHGGLSKAGNDAATSSPAFTFGGTSVQPVATATAPAKDADTGDNGRRKKRRNDASFSASKEPTQAPLSFSAASTTEASGKSSAEANPILFGGIKGVQATTTASEKKDDGPSKAGPAFSFGATDNAAASGPPSAPAFSFGAAPAAASAASADPDNAAAAPAPAPFKFGAGSTAGSASTTGLADGSSGITTAPAALAFSFGAASASSQPPNAVPRPTPGTSFGMSFGKPQAQAPPPASGLPPAPFGNASTTSATSQTMTTSSNAFGSTAGPAPFTFGAANTVASAGPAAAAPAPFVFGSAPQAAPAAPPANAAFGQPPPFGGPPGNGNSGGATLFGQPTAGPTSFGSAAPPANVAPAFGSAPTFGAPQQQPFGGGSGGFGGGSGGFGNAAPAPAPPAAPSFANANFGAPQNAGPEGGFSMGQAPKANQKRRIVRARRPPGSRRA